MKTFTLLLIVLFAALAGRSQTAQFGKISGNAQYESYIPKTSDQINVGDTIQLGKPSGEFGFIYITQGGERVKATLAGNKVKITQIKSYGTKKAGYKLWVQFKGYGLVPVFVDYDTALETGEIVNPRARMTREQAISKLKEAKDLLDLKMMTEAEYDSLKNQLAPLIRTN